MRKLFIGKSPKGNCYAPFIGDGDIASDLYSDRKVYGVDLDEERVAVARGKLKSAEIKIGDAEQWHFRKGMKFAIADFDAYSNPYLAIECFLKNASLVPGGVVFGTDAFRQSCKRKKKVYVLPSGEFIEGDWRAAYNRWFIEHVKPFLLSAFGEISAEKFYTRKDMLYWAIVAGSPNASRKNGKASGDTVLEGVKAAAESGNVQAAKLYYKLTGKSQDPRESSNERNKAIRRKQQEVEIPQLTKEQKVKRLRLESDPPAWIWEMAGPKSDIEAPLTRKLTSCDEDMIGSFFETLHHGGSKFTLASRGAGKTSRLRECIWLGLASGRLEFEVYFAANLEKAKDSQDFIEHAVASSETFLNLYPEIALPVRKLAHAPQAARGMIATGYPLDLRMKKFEKVPIRFQWSAKGLWFPRVPGSPSAGARFLSYGLEKPPRGLNKLGSRPTHVSIDDPDTLETVENYAQAEKVISFINFDIGGLGGESRSVGIDILCTMSHKGEGVAYRLSGEDSAYVVNRHQFLIDPPQRMDLWQKYIELRRRAKFKGDAYGRDAHKFYLANKSDMDAGAKVANVHRFDASPCPDGSQSQASALQWYFDQWADRGELFCRCELDNERIVIEDELKNHLTQYHVASNCTGELDRLQVADSTSLAVAGVDIRKIELHHCCLAADASRDGRIFDYNVHSHGTTETTVEMAEDVILESLRRFAKYLRDNQPHDSDGVSYPVDLCLIDKGWIGSWKEDGETKTWASQPVETFCMDAGLRRFLPAHGAPRYAAPKPDRFTIAGDNWHINRGRGKNRRCDEVIWSKAHWTQKVEERFQLDPGNRFAFEMFSPIPGSLWKSHQSFANHIIEGIDGFYETMKNPAKEKRKYRKDHWFDSLAMALVAQSVELHFREHPKKASGRKRNASSRPSLADLARK